MWYCSLIIRVSYADSIYACNFDSELVLKYKIACHIFFQRFWTKAHYIVIFHAFRFNLTEMSHEKSASFIKHVEVIKVYILAPSLWSFGFPSVLYYRPWRNTTWNLVLEYRTSLPYLLVTCGKSPLIWIRPCLIYVNELKHWTNVLPAESGSTFWCNFVSSQCRRFENSYELPCNDNALSLLLLLGKYGSRCVTMIIR